MTLITLTDDNNCYGIVETNLSLYMFEKVLNKYRNETPDYNIEHFQQYLIKNNIDATIRDYENLWF